MATLPNPLPDPAAAGLDLPPGSLVDATLDGPWHEPLLWYADGAADQGDWAGLRAAGRRVGLLPVLVTGGQRDQWPEAWDLSPDSASYPGDHDPEEVLAGYWTDYADDELGDAAPADGASGEPGDGASGKPETGSGTGSGSGSAGAWPGLAPVPAREAAEDPDTAAAGIVAVVAGDADLWLGGTRMALVPARCSVPGRTGTTPASWCSASTR